MGNFKRLTSYPDYAVNALGQVFSFKTYKILKPLISSVGYEQVCLYGGTGPKRPFIHRLVAEAFLGRSNLDVNHKDGNPRNNKLENLEFCSRQENIIHTYRTGLKRTKLTDAQILEIRRRYSSESIISLGKEFGVGHAMISKIAKGKLYKHLPVPPENLGVKKICRKT